MPIGGFKAGFREWFWSRCWAVGFVFVASKTSGWFLQWFIAGTPLGHLIIYNSVYKHNTYKKYICTLHCCSARQCAARRGEGERGSETTLGEDTKDPTTHWGSERIGRKD